jgi:arylsulfatase A-like enzyme
MTGKYPLSVGMQNFVITSDEPFGLPLSEKIMPQYFKDAGYKTHLIGKWHLGFYQKQYAPTNRGFDSFFGYLGPYIDYWSYTLFMLDRNYSRGYDLRKNLEITRKYQNVYATEMFTNEAVDLINNHDKKNPMFLLLTHLAPHAANQDDPMQAPQDEVNKFSYIENPKRRKLAAMISILDRGIGEVVRALKEKDMLENTVIALYSDNGGPTIALHSTNASNYPLRGVSRNLN